MNGDHPTGGNVALSTECDAINTLSFVWHNVFIYLMSVLFLSTSHPIFDIYLLFLFCFFPSDPIRGSPHPAHAVLRGRAVWLLSAYATLFERSLTEAICEVQNVDIFFWRQRSVIQSSSWLVCGNRTIPIYLRNLSHLLSHSYNSDTSGVFAVHGSVQPADCAAPELSGASSDRHQDKHFVL